MNEWILAAAIFLGAYLLNIFYITVLYHRGLAHGAAKLSPWATSFVAKTGVWITGIDPKAWVCMHRLHHMYSDQERDPHSPAQYGIFGVAMAQLRSYEGILRGLIRRQPATTKIVADLDFDVSIVNKKKLWYLPYAIHFIIGLILGLALQSYIIPVAYFLGMMSHPVQGWMVNSLAHSFGYRNFKTGDQSTNNWFVALFVFGEGYQNNHHAYPKAANFAMKKFEVDLGYTLCLLAQGLGILKIPSKVAGLEPAVSSAWDQSGLSESPSRPVNSSENR